MDKFYCPKCDKYVETAIQSRKEEIINVRGIPIKLKHTQARICNICKNDVYDRELDMSTLIRAYEKYELKTKEPILEKHKENFEKRGLIDTPEYKLILKSIKKRGNNND